MSTLTVANIAALGTGPLNFLINGIGRLTLDANGHLVQSAVTTNVATNQYVINVNGNSYAAFYDVGLSGSNGGLAISGTTVVGTVPTNATMFWNVNTNTVGIGTTNAVQKVTVQAAPNPNGFDGVFIYNGNLLQKVMLGITGSTYSYSGIGPNQAWLYSGSNDLNIGPDGPNVIKFVTNANERVRITSQGYVNIGTGVNNPNNRALFVGGAIGLSNDGTTEAAKWYTDGTLAYLDSGGVGQSFYAGGVERVRIASNGNVGIGAAPTGGRKLEVYGAGATAYDVLNISNPTGGGNLLLGLSATGTGALFCQGGGNILEVGAQGQVIFTTGSTAGASTKRMVIDNSGNVLVTGGGGLGYGTGSGGTVTQATSKSTPVTLNTTSGQIIMNNAALAANTHVQFQCVNSTIGVNDTVSVSIDSTMSYGYYTSVYTKAGGFYVDLWNTTGGSLSEAVIIKFNVVRGSIN